MKKQLPVFIFSAVILMSITSCKKSDSNPSNSSTGTLLSEFVELDTTKAVGSDTLTVTYYTYDNLKRLSTVSYIFFDNYVRDVASYNTYDLSYNGTDTLFDKSIHKLLEAGVQYDGITDTEYVSYNSDGKEIKDSVSGLNFGYQVPNGTPFITVSNFSYNGGMVTNQQTDLGNPVSSYDTVLQTTANGNIVSQIDNNLGDSSVCTISLDTHPNPFFKNGVNVTPIFGLYEDIDVDGMQDGAQKNNCLDFKKVDVTTVDALHVQNQFTYKSNGYPASVIEYNTQNFLSGYVGSNTPAFNFKGIYIYQ